MKRFILSFFAFACLSATCNEGRKTISGDCLDQSKIDPEMACIEVYQPVCGCDGKTYPNACYARRSGITRWEDGPCEQE